MRLLILFLWNYLRHNESNAILWLLAEGFHGLVTSGIKLEFRDPLDDPDDDDNKSESDVSST
jgi:hypothetical protein